MQYLKYLSCAVLAAAVVGCGGGGGNPGGSSGGATPGQTPARIELTYSGDLTTATGASVTITAQVVDKASAAISGQKVVFSADSGVLSAGDSTTGSKGEAATVNLSSGANKSNRTIKVTATASGIASTLDVLVSGTTLSVSGANSLLKGTDASTFTVTATDGGNVPIGGATITIASSLGNSLSSNSVVTDAKNGTATFTLIPAIAGNDTITTTGLGTTNRPPLTVAISATNFSITSPTVSSLPVNSDQILTVQYLNNGVGVAGKTVIFSTTRGTVRSLTPTSGVTDSNGVASAIVTSTSSGPATLSASILGIASITKAIQFIATDPATISLQATPTAISPNDPGSVTNQSSLLATVRDSSGNPVTGVIVAFSAVSDGSGGSISAPSAVTDSNGQAKSAYISGANPTATNGVVIAANVTGFGVPTATTSLTVSGKSLFISIGFGNTIVPDNNKTNYIKTFSVYVTDARGGAVANQVLSLSVYPNRYGKGTLVWSDAMARWVYDASSPTPCLNEDANKNGTLDAGEDNNNNGKLEPGEPIVINPGQVVTDSSGYASFTLNYGEQYTSWLFNVDIVARGIVSGTESKNIQSVPFIWGVAGDYTNKSIEPADKISPFGTSTDCKNPN